MALEATEITQTTEVTEVTEGETDHDHHWHRQSPAASAGLSLSTVNAGSVWSNLGTLSRPYPNSGEH